MMRYFILNQPESTLEVPADGDCLICLEADILVQSKISKAKEQGDEAIERVNVIRRELEAKLY